MNRRFAPVNHDNMQLWTSSVDIEIFDKYPRAAFGLRPHESQANSPARAIGFRASNYSYWSRLAVFGSGNIT